MRASKRIPNYDLKFDHLWEYQCGRCAITWAFFQPRDKIEMHHLLQESKVNCDKYPLFIHSVWNLRLVEGGAHDTKPLPEHLPWMVAERVEKHLQDHPDVAALINMELPGRHNVNETQNLLDDLLIEVWPERR